MSRDVPENPCRCLSMRLKPNSVALYSTSHPPYNRNPTLATLAFLHHPLLRRNPFPCFLLRPTPSRHFSITPFLVMKVECQVLTTPTSDSPGTCLLLHFDNKRYLIGHIGEGSQRAFSERGARLAKVTDIFLSGRTEWRNTGGLVGLLLTMGDQEEGKLIDSAAVVAKGRKGMSVHGGENLMHTLATTRAFVFRKAMKLKINEIPKRAAGEDTRRITPYFKDENMVIWPMHIHPEGYQPATALLVDLPEEKTLNDKVTTKKRSFDEISDSDKTRGAILQSVVEDMFCSDWTMETMVEDALGAGRPINENDMMNSPSSLLKRPCSIEQDPQLSTRLPPPGKTRAPWPASTIKVLPRSTPSPVAISYIVTLHPQRGRFLPKKAIALGVKPGPDFARIAAGEIFTLADGAVVKPEDVMEATRPGTGFAVCDLPDKTYIADFLAQEEWKDTERLKVEIGCFFWLLGEGVAAEERIQDFINALPHARHIVSSVDVCPNSITFKGAAMAAAKLNLMDPTYFPHPHASNIAPSCTLSSIEPALPGLTWQIEPKWELQSKSVEPLFDVEKVLAETEPEYARLAKEIRDQNEQMMQPEASDGGWGDIEVITLGTGSALPSKYRNVSGTLLRVPGSGTVLFDCGENTFGQLRRLYGPVELRGILRDLKAVYISHLHADHHLGTVSALKAWYEEVHIKSIDATEDRDSNNNKETMTIIAPWKFLIWLQEYADVEEYGFSKIRFISCEDVSLKSRSHPNAVTGSYLSEALNSLSLESIQTSPAVHCQNSYTTAWTWANGFKFAYSGDTRPTRSFVEIGRGATILLHEATFDDELVGEAIAKKHSTTSEALKAGRDMGARGVVLTHFSQRYPKLPVLSEAVEEGMEVVLAFDLCRVKVKNIERFEGFMAGLRELYKYEEVEEGVEEDDEEAKEEARKLKMKQHKLQQKKEKRERKEKKAKGKKELEVEV